ncbi:MAG: hypothetical protein CK533_12670 [Acidobacterium sp.]|nr:MAG: hypothetical protein CK533_12670 [Acidobacterium sp.]
MSAYRLDDERAIRVGRLVEDWAKSGLLTPDQRDVIAPQLAVDLRRTNNYLRATLFVFGGVILQSTLGLMAIMLGGLLDETLGAALGLAAGGVCYWLAMQLVSRYHLYRFGIEEVAALSAVGLTAVGAALLVGGDWSLTIGLSTAAGVFAALFIHFGFVYAGVFGLVALAALPFLFGDSLVTQRLGAVMVLVLLAATARLNRVEDGDEYPGDALTIIEAAAWLGIYLLVNLVVSGAISPLDRASTFHWITYGGIWILPAAGLWLALRGRERPLLWVAVAMALGTLLSNKEYLGSPRYEWDPIVFGVFLMVIAIGLRRWLAAGDGGMRHGYTASRLAASDKARIGALALVSAAQVEVPVAQSTPAADPGIGGGGRSGGAGAGGSF